MPNDCAHGAVYVEPPDTSRPPGSFWGQYGVSVQGETRCGCCGRFFLGSCSICAESEVGAGV